MKKHSKFFDDLRYVEIIVVNGKIRGIKGLKTPP